MEGKKRSRNPNFSADENLRITIIMGEISYARDDLTNYDLIKHRFTGGRGGNVVPLGCLTNAVMDVVGRDAPTIAGAVDAWFDTTMVSLELPNDNVPLGVPLGDFNIPAIPPAIPSATVSHSAASIDRRRPCPYGGSGEEAELRKKKLKLQIRLLERQLAEQ